MYANWEVAFHAEVEAWLLGVDLALMDRITEAVDALQVHGPMLGRPLVDTVRGSRYANMKELRVSSVRLLFAFDSSRRAIVLVAGDKRGEWSQWYRKAIPLADDRFDWWLSEGRNR